MTIGTTENRKTDESGLLASPALSLDSNDQIKWFIQLRWIAVLVSAALVILSVDVLEILPHSVRIPLFVSVGVLIALNTTYTILLRTGRRTLLRGPFQAYADLVLLVSMLHFSGGIENPLVLLMVFHVIIAGITLTKRQCYLVTGFAALVFSGLAFAEMSGVIPHYTLQVIPHFQGAHGETAHVAHDPVYAVGLIALIDGILFMTAAFVTTLSDRLREKEQQLQLMADRAMTQAQLLERSLETTGTALFVCDDRFELVLTNRRWDDWFKDIEHEPNLREQVLGDGGAVRRTFESRRVGMTELSISPDPDHAMLPAEVASQTFQITTAPLVDADGHCTHVVALVQDITEQKSAQASMLRAGKLAAVGELAGQVAHEVNNPIAIINAKSRLLLSDRREKMTDDVAEEIEKLIGLSSRVAEIAQGLLSYARPSTSEMTPQIVTPWVSRALNMVRQRAENRGIQIEEDLPDDVPETSVNAKEIEQIFLNLFLNALDAMPDGGHLKVFARSSDSNGQQYVDIITEDSGSGMPLDIQDRIFEPFFTTKPEGQGTGLGLSVCHGLVSRYGGSIKVKSKEGKGTSMTVRLPVHQFDSE